MKYIYKLLLVLMLLITNVPVLSATDEEKPIDKNSIEINSDSIVLIDMNTMNILYEKNGDKKAAPASITKMLANLVAVNILDLEKMYTVTKEAIDNVPANSARLWLTYDEKVKGIELVNSSLIASANDSTHVLAVASKGTQEAFCDEMNKYVQSYGLKNTHFSNPSGLIEDEHYTTAKDFAVIATHVFENDLLTSIMGTNYYEMNPTNKMEEKRKFVNGHPLVKHGPDTYEYIVGGKTGWDGANNYTMVSYAKKDNLNLLVVSLNGNTRKDVTEDHMTLFNYGFSNYKTIKINKDTIEPINKEYYKGKYLDSIVNLELENDLNILVDYNVKDYDVKTEVVISDEESLDTIKGIIKVSIKGNYVGDIELKKTIESFDVSFSNTILKDIINIINMITIGILFMFIALAINKFIIKKV